MDDLLSVTDIVFALVRETGAEIQPLADSLAEGYPLEFVNEPPPPAGEVEKYRNYFLFAHTSEIFRIDYVDRDGGEKNFLFSLMPAIESNLSMSPSSPLTGGQGARVPEAKPGLLDRLAMKYVRRGVAGAPPAIQSMGIEQRIWQLVGTYIGDELRAPGHSASVFPSSPRLLPSVLNAFDVADFFSREVVMVGRPVDVTVMSYRPDDDDIIEIKYRAVIQSCRNLHARTDRTYYAFDFLITEYYDFDAPAPIIPPPPEEEGTSDTTPQPVDDTGTEVLPLPAPTPTPTP